MRKERKRTGGIRRLLREGISKITFIVSVIGVLFAQCALFFIGAERGNLDIHHFGKSPGFA